MAKKELTDKQEQFCREYLLDFNATQAAIRAGYSKRTANEQGARLLANVSVQNFLQIKKEKLESKSDITREKVLAEYAKLAFFNVQDMLTVDNALRPIRDLDANVAAAIVGIDTQDMTVEDMVIGKTIKLKLADKRAALDSICRVLGYNSPDKIEGTFDLSKLPITFK
jgi:phage terminase small subunit